MSAPFRLTFELPGLPAMANENRRTQHWSIKAREAKRWKLAVFLVTRAHRPKAPLKRAKLTLTRCSAVSPDNDGCVSGFKHVIDGLVDAGILENDKMENIGMADYKWEKAPPRKGRIRVEVTEIV